MPFDGNAEDWSEEPHHEPVRRFGQSRLWGGRVVLYSLTIAVVRALSILFVSSLYFRQWCLGPQRETVTL